MRSGGRSHPNPATSYFKSATGGREGGKLGPRGSTPISGLFQRLLRLQQHSTGSTPLPPSGQGKRLCPQYLLIPKIRTPWNWGSLGISTLIKDTVLRTKWIWSYLV